MEINQKQRNLVLENDLKSVMRKLAVPAIAAMVLFGLNAFMDTVYIGQLMDETALGGVALAYPLTGMMMGLGSWAGTGAGNLLSIALGKNDEDTQSKILGNITLFMLLSTLVFAVPAYVFAEDLIAMLGGEGEVLDYGTRYFQVTLLASPLWVYGLGLNFLVRAEGKMKEAAIMMSYGLVLNLILTPVFIQYLDMGVEGAAWATNLGMLVYSLTGYIYFRRGKASFQSKLHSLRFDGPVQQSIASLGFPGFIMTVMGLVQSIVVFNAIMHVGTERDLVIFAAANRILFFMMTPLFGLMRALQPVVGINFGARQFARVKGSFFLFSKTGFYLVAPFWLFMMIFPEVSLGLVLPEMVFRPGELWYFRVYMLILPVLPMVFMALTYLPAIDQPKWASILGLARQVVFYVPVMIFLPHWIGISGVYYGSTAIDLIVTLWLLYIVWRSFASLNQGGGQKEGETPPSPS